MSRYKYHWMSSYTVVPWPDLTLTLTLTWPISKEVDMGIVRTAVSRPKRWFIIRVGLYSTNCVRKRVVFQQFHWNTIKCKIDMVYLQMASNYDQRLNNKVGWEHSALWARFPIISKSRSTWDLSVTSFLGIILTVWRRQSLAFRETLNAGGWPFRSSYSHGKFRWSW